VQAVDFSDPVSPKCCHWEAGIVYFFIFRIIVLCFHFSTMTVPSCLDIDRVGALANQSQTLDLNRVQSALFRVMVSNACLKIVV